MSNLRETSKQNFGLVGSGPTYQEIQLGAMQRIADATEAMARSHTQLISERDSWKRRSELAEQREKSTARSLVAMRGQVTKLRNQLAARAAPAPAPTPDALDGARLDSLSRPGWELSMSDDPEVPPWQLWQVHCRRGGWNDREWTLLGTGATPRDAIDAAMAKDQKP